MPASPAEAGPAPAGLDSACILGQLGQPELALAIEPSLGSTNQELARRRAQGERLEVLLAEQQTAGRGRQGRQWLSPPRRGLYLSMAHDFAQPARKLGALALVTGLAAAAAVSAHSFVPVTIKWPNDLLVKGRKLGGCLIDLSASHSQHTQAIIGIGINVDLGEYDGPDQPWTDLARAGGSTDRNQLAALLILHLQQDLAMFERSGFDPFQGRWDRHDLVGGQRLRVQRGDTWMDGIGRGVDGSGALWLETAAGLLSLHAGEVSLCRLAP